MYKYSSYVYTIKTKSIQLIAVTLCKICIATQPYKHLPHWSRGDNYGGNGCCCMGAAGGTCVCDGPG